PSGSRIGGRPGACGPAASASARDRPLALAGVLAPSRRLGGGLRAARQHGDHPATRAIRRSLLPLRRGHGAWATRRADRSRDLVLAIRPPPAPPSPRNPLRVRGGAVRAAGASPTPGDRR